LLGAQLSGSGTPGDSMGVTDAWAQVGVNAGWGNVKGRSHVETEGKAVAVELYGLASKHVMKLFNDDDKAKKVAMHLCGGEALADPEQIVAAAHGVVVELVNIASACDRLFVVSEGNFDLKRPEGHRRAEGRAIALAERKYRSAVGVTDCLIRLVRNKFISEPLDNVHYIDLEYTEGEFELMHLLNTRVADIALLYSNDADVLYIKPEHGTVVLCPSVLGRIGGRKIGGVKGIGIWGKAVEIAGLWKKYGKNDCSEWTAEYRACLPALVGHDYDLEKGGAKNFGHAKGLTKIGKWIRKKGRRRRRSARIDKNASTTTA